MWELEFNQSKTEQNFTLTHGNVVQIPMIQRISKSEFNYANLEDLEILELPYKGDKISMLILLPKTNLSVIQPTLTAEKFNEYRNKMHKTVLNEITLPKFEFNSEYFMKEALSSLGMPNAFMDGANFSGITSAGSVYIKQVIHQAYIKVDEKGTEAAASTAVVMTRGNNPVFRADHPFIFIIQDTDNGNILFMGRLVVPRD